MGLAEKQLADANTVIANLKEESVHKGETIASLRATLVESENNSAHVADARVAALERRLAALSQEKVELVNHANQLPDRAREGNLVCISMSKTSLSLIGIYVNLERERKGIHTTNHGKCISGSRRG